MHIRKKYESKNSSIAYVTSLSYYQKVHYFYRPILCPFFKLGLSCLNTIYVKNRQGGGAPNRAKEKGKARNMAKVFPGSLKIIHSTWNNSFPLQSPSLHLWVSCIVYLTPSSSFLSVFHCNGTTQCKLSATKSPPKQDHLMGSQKGVSLSSIHCCNSYVCWFCS